MTTTAPTTTAEKLSAIATRCHELLALAEKRTPGKWDCVGTSLFKNHWVIGSMNCHEFVAEDCPIVPRDEQEVNAAYIAACAGAAEAGWRATIAAIEGLRYAKTLAYTTSAASVVIDREMNNILTAWEGQGLWT